MRRKLTVYQKMHEGDEAIQAKAEIIKILGSHHVSNIAKIVILDMLALELKIRSIMEN